MKTPQIISIKIYDYFILKLIFLSYSNKIIGLDIRSKKNKFFYYQKS